MLKDFKARGLVLEALQANYTEMLGSIKDMSTRFESIDSQLFETKIDELSNKIT